MPEHARLSASSAKAWMACGGYVAFNDYAQEDEEASVYAQEGTEAHALAEKILKGLFLGGPKIRKQKSFDDDMYYYVRNYVDYVYDLHRKLVRKYGKDNVHIRIEQKLDFSNIVPEGFGTGDCVILTPNELHIIDLKYGKGVMVSAYENPQLMLYGIGAINQYGPLYDIENVVLHIAQVRMDEYSSYEISTEELFEFGKSIEAKAKQIATGNITYHPGVEQCRWCKGRSSCLERGKQLLLPIMEIIRKEEDL